MGSSSLPVGFEVDQPQGTPDLPPGFQVDGPPPGFVVDKPNALQAAVNNRVKSLSFPAATPGVKAPASYQIQEEQTDPLTGKPVQPLGPGAPIPTRKIVTRDMTGPTIGVPRTEPLTRPFKDVAAGVEAIASVPGEAYRALVPEPGGKEVTAPVTFHDPVTGKPFSAPAGFDQVISPDKHPYLRAAYGVGQTAASAAGVAPLAALTGGLAGAVTPELMSGAFAVEGLPGVAKALNETSQHATPENLANLGMQSLLTGLAVLHATKGVDALKGAARDTLFKAYQDELGRRYAAQEADRAYGPPVGEQPKALPPGPEAPPSNLPAVAPAPAAPAAEPLRSAKLRVADPNTGEASVLDVRDTPQGGVEVHESGEPVATYPTVQAFHDHIAQVQAQAPHLQMAEVPNESTLVPEAPSGAQGRPAEGDRQGGGAYGARPPGTRPVAGAETSVPIPGEGNSIPARYEVWELADVYPSHSGLTFNPNEAYEHHNERDYSKPENQQRIIEQSTDGRFDPRYHLTDNPDAVNGPPIIDENGNVLGGNSRSMVLQRIHSSPGLSANAYRQMLEQRSAQFGIDPEALRGMRQPVLVRVVPAAALDALPGGAKWAIRKTNVSGMAALSASERTAADAGQMTPEMIVSISQAMDDAGSDSSLNDALSGRAGAAIGNNLIAQGFFNEAERPALMDGKTGELTPVAKDRISKALLGQFFENSDQIARVPADVKGKLERIAPQVLRASSDPKWDITAEVKQAVRMVEEMRARGAKNITVNAATGGKDLDYLVKSGVLGAEEAKRYLVQKGDKAGQLTAEGKAFVEDELRKVQQQELITNQSRLDPSQPGYSPQAAAFARILMRSPNEAAAAFRAYANDAASAGDDSQMTFFTPPTPDEAYREAFGVEKSAESAKPTEAPPAPAPQEPALSPGQAMFQEALHKAAARKAAITAKLTPMGTLPPQRQTLPERALTPQELQASISEAEALLESGRIDGKPIGQAKRESLNRQIREAQAKLGETPVLESALPAGFVLDEAPKVQPKEPWEMTKGELVPHKATKPVPKYTPETSGGYSEAEMHERTLRNRANETEAPDVTHHPVGSWGTDSTGELMQLREYRLDDPRLIFPEGMPHPQSQTVQKYADWINGGSESPALTGLETEKGNIKITEGHHRAAAVKATGGDKVKVWVSVTHNRPLGNGQVMPEGLTHEGAVKSALAEGKPVPPEVLADYPGLKPPAEAPPDAGPVTLGSGLGAFEPYFKESIAEGNRLKAIRDAAKAALDKAKTTAEQFKAGELARRYFLSERDLWSARINQVLSQVKRVIAPKVPEREAIGIYREFKTRREELVQFLDGEHQMMIDHRYRVSQLEEGGKARAQAQKEYDQAIDRLDFLRPAMEKALAWIDGEPMPVHLQAANKIYTQIASDSLNEGRAGGWLESRWTSDEYMPHAFHKHGEGLEAKAPSTEGRTMGKIGKFFGFGQRRSDPYPTMLHGIADGLVPKTMDPNIAFAVHADGFARARATHKLEEYLQSWGMGQWGEGADAPQGWVPLARHTEEFKRQQAYLDDEEGQPKISSTRLYVPAFINQALAPITAYDFTPEIPGFAKLRSFQRELKAAILGFSGFHLLTENFMALADFGPAGMWKAFQAEIDSPEFLTDERDLIGSTGTTAVQGSTMDAYRLLQPGSIPTRGEIIRAYIPGSKQALDLADKITELTFDNVQRRFKVIGFALHRDAWMAEHPNATFHQIEEAKSAIASYTNGVFGGLHWENLGWRRAWVEVARAIFLAPDWSGSNLVLAKYALNAPWTPGDLKLGSARMKDAFTKEAIQARLARAFWTKQFLGGIIATAALSLLFTGKLSKNPFKVHLGTDSDGNDVEMNVFFRGSIGDAVTAGTNIKRYGVIGGATATVSSKFAPVTKALGNQISQRDSLGRPLADPNLNWFAMNMRRAGLLVMDLSPVPITIRSAKKTFTGEDADKYLWSEKVLGLFGPQASHVAPEGMRKTARGLRADRTADKPQNSIWDQMVTGKATAPRRQR